MQNEFQTAAIYSFFAVKFIRKSKNFLPGHRVKLKEEEEEEKKDIYKLLDDAVI